MKLKYALLAALFILGACSTETSAEKDVRDNKRAEIVCRTHEGHLYTATRWAGWGVANRYYVCSDGAEVLAPQEK